MVVVKTTRATDANLTMRLRISVLITTTLSILATCWVLLSPSGAFATPLSRDDFRQGETAFAAARQGDWAKVRHIADRVSDPTLEKLLVWTDLIRSEANVPFSDRANFIRENPEWPWQRRLRRLAEESMSQTMPPTAVISWFERFEPLTTTGRVRLGAALLATGQQTRGQNIIRNAWINDDFSTAEEQEFVLRYGRLLTTESHLQRLDRLLWEGDRDQALRMFPRVGADDRLVAEARIRLRQMSPRAPATLAQVPTARRRDPGLVYEQLRWQRRSELDEAALRTLGAYPLDPVRPELWWKERSILSRRALADGRVSEAYRIARDHALTDGAAFADAHWLSGWIALRFLQQPAQAAKHFETMFNAVQYPISRSRGAYWAGRAAELAGNKSVAAEWYAKAARHPTTFYGQLATVQRAQGNALKLPPNPVPRPAEAAAFNTHELVRAVEILAAYGQTSRLRPFVYRVGELQDSVAWQSQAAALANRHGQHHLAVAIAKMAAKDGRVLTVDGYPTVRVPKAPVPTLQTIEDPLVLAMVRQESAFRADAVSPAGARGLMQLMPGTARQVAPTINVSYSQPRLTTDTSYNLNLGQAYMAKMLQRFGGSTVLALAAYNAGPNRVEEWMRNSGRPRGDLFLAIDWIEQIPYAETRNYVQRILENLQVYRLRLGQSASGVTIADDLKR